MLIPHAHTYLGSPGFKLLNVSLCSAGILSISSCVRDEYGLFINSVESSVELGSQYLGGLFINKDVTKANLLLLWSETEPVSTAPTSFIHATCLVHPVEGSSYKSGYKHSHFHLCPTASSVHTYLPVYLLHGIFAKSLGIQ